MELLRLLVLLVSAGGVIAGGGGGDEDGAVATAAAAARGVGVALLFPLLSLYRVSLSEEDQVGFSFLFFVSITLDVCVEEGGLLGGVCSDCFVVVPCVVLRRAVLGCGWARLGLAGLIWAGLS